VALDRRGDPNVPARAVLQRAASCCDGLHCNVLRCSGALRCNVLRCSGALRCNDAAAAAVPPCCKPSHRVATWSTAAVQHRHVCCVLLQRVALGCLLVLRCANVHCAATCSAELQRVATSCSAPRRVAARWHCVATGRTRAVRPRPSRTGTR
jgi:hypothetical protein